MGQKRIETNGYETLKELARTNKTAAWIVTRALDRPGWSDDACLIEEMILPDGPLSENELADAVKTYMDDIEEYR